MTVVKGASGNVTYIIVSDVIVEKRRDVDRTLEPFLPQ